MADDQYPGRWWQENWAAMAQQQLNAIPQELMNQLGNAGWQPTGAVEMSMRQRLSREGNREEWARYQQRQQRARELLHQHLSAEQSSELARWGWFEVVGRVRGVLRWRNYRFRVHEHGHIYEVTPRRRRHYCIMTLEPGLPRADWLLVVKMLIESDLPRFFAIAHKRAWEPVNI